MKPDRGTVDGFGFVSSNSKRYLCTKVAKNIKIFIRARASPGQARFPVKKLKFGAFRSKSVRLNIGSGTYLFQKE